MTREIKIGDIKVGANNPLILIAGPCVIESEKHCLDTAKKIKDIAQESDIPFIFKSSFDKANRLSIDSYRGPGFKRGLEILAKVKQKLKVPVLSDIHCQSEIKEAAKILDIIQSLPFYAVRQISW